MREMVKSNDVVQYYFGSDFQFIFNNGEIIFGRVEHINDTGFLCGSPSNKQINDEDDWYEIDDFRKSGKLKLVLKHPCDMTTLEKRAYKALCKPIIDSNGSTMHFADTPASLHYLFTHSVDAFDLIETDQAVDINSKPQ